MEKRLVNKKKKTLTVKEILLSPSLSNLINKENRAIFKNWKVPGKKLDIIDINSENTAWTDNVTLTINVNANMFKEASRDEAFLYLYGLTFHEIGHVLFTSYTGMKEYSQSIVKGVLWPSNPHVSEDYKENLKELTEYIKDPIKAKNLYSLISVLANAIEDPRIEHFLMAFTENCSKYKKGLKATQKYLFERMSSIPELREKGITDVALLNQLLFNYARFGEIAGLYELKEEYEKDEIYQYFLKVTTFVENAVYSEKSAQFYNNLNNIIVICWPVYKKFLDEMQENDEPSPSSEKNPSDKEETSDDKEENDDKEKNDDKDGSKSEETSTSEKDVSEKIKKELEETLEGITPTHDEDEESRMEGTDPDKMDVDELKSRGGGISKEEMFEDEDGAKINLDSVIRRIAEEEADKELSQKNVSELTKIARSIEYSDMNKNVSIELRRPKITPAMKTEYNSYEIQSIVKVGKEVAKKILKTLPQEKEPITLKNRVIGTKFDASAVARNDLKYFSKNSKPEEGPSLSIGLVVDESGSMSCFERDVSAKAAAVALHSCAESLGVPVSIYGHTADERGYDVNLIDYADHSKPDSNDKYRLMNIQARRNNRDAVPIQFVCERLIKSDCEKKLLIVISDGQPAAHGYGGELAEEDMKRTIKKYAKAGITIIAAAIGSDKENIKRIYSPERFLDITNLEDLPKEMLRIVKRNMR